MLPAPRVIVIDDEPRHLDGLADGLTRYGAACLKVYFTGETAPLKPCPHVRVIFADLHLTNGGAGEDDAMHYAVIGGLIEESIKPAGPYLVVLWTKFADKADGLQQFLNRLHGVPRPFAVVALDKNEHLNADGSVKDPQALLDAIIAIVRSQPQIAALLNWEEQVLGAAADTVSAIMGLATLSGDPGRYGTELARLLGHLAIAAVGQKNVDQDRFHAVNEALLPILADRVAALRAADAGEADIWNNAFAAESATALSQDEAGRLNRLVHVADATTAAKGCDWGAVIDLPADLAGERFTEYFSIPADAAAKDCFGCKDYLVGSGNFRWVLVQAQAACDFAQKQPGPLPFYLGLEMPASSLVGRGARPGGLWASPYFESGGVLRVLCVHSRFHISRSEKSVEGIKPAYRLRAQLLNQLIYHLHSHGARPGVISFREGSQKAPAAAAVAKPARAAATPVAVETVAKAGK